MNGERAFLESYDVTKFDRPSVAVDVVMIGIESDDLVVLVVRRTEHPARETFALPGGFLRLDESLDDAAKRVLREKAALENVYLEQLYTFGAVDRDPRTRVIAVTYYALVAGTILARTARDRDAAIARVRPRGTDDFQICDTNGSALTLAFDHTSIVHTAIRRIRGKLDYAPIGYELLPQAFTLLQLQRVHETIAGRRFNKDSFRRRMLASTLLEPTQVMQEGVGHRPAAMYRYVNR